MNLAELHTSIADDLVQVAVLNAQVTQSLQPLHQFCIDLVLVAHRQAPLAGHQAASTSTARAAAWAGKAASSQTGWIVAGSLAKRPG